MEIGMRELKAVRGGAQRFETSAGSWRDKAPGAVLVVFTDFVSKKRCVLK